MAKEYRADRAAQKNSEHDGGSEEHAGDQAENSTIEDHSEEDYDNDELAKQLDAAQHEIDHGGAPDASPFNEEDWVQTFIEAHPPPSAGQQQPEGVLSMPVVIPQRHPGMQGRGVIRAYAPILPNAGIDAQGFMH